MPAGRLLFSVLSESPADEQALRLIVPALVAQPVEFLSTPFRARGWPSVSQVLPMIAHHLHFQTEADALVVVVDSDESPVHTAEHERDEYFHPRCRLCQLRAVFRRAVKNFPPARGRARTLRCVGVAVPAMEAWYLCGRDEQVTEEAWVLGQQKGIPPYTRAELKQRLYGTDRPSLAWEIQCLRPEMERHARDSRRLENDFFGFHLLAREVRQVPAQTFASLPPET